MAYQPFSRHKHLVSVPMEIHAHAIGPHPRQPPLDPRQSAFGQQRPKRDDTLLDYGAWPAKVVPEGGLEGAPKALSAKCTNACGNPPKQQCRQSSVVDMDETQHSIRNV